MEKPVALGSSITLINLSSPDRNKPGSVGQAIPGCEVRIAEAGGVMAAYAKLGPLSLPWDADRPSIELKQFYVLAPWHGRGIAPVLMEWVLEEAGRRGASDMYLSVFTDNHRAQRFYARYGFEVVGRHHFMVGTHADEVLALGREVGIPGRYLQQALLEEIEETAHMHIGAVMVFEPPNCVIPERSMVTLPGVMLISIDSSRIFIGASVAISRLTA